MQTTFELSTDLHNIGRIAHVVYQVKGEETTRRVTTVPNENVSDAVLRELMRLRSMAVTDFEVVSPGREYAYRFADGNVLEVEIL